MINLRSTPRTAIWTGALACTVWVCLCVSYALATDLDGRYANSPNRDWYRNAELTPAARARFLFDKCCDHADVFRTQFKVNKTTGGDEWWYLSGAEWKRVPDDIIHVDKHAPDNQPTLFIYAGKETCFFPGGSGI